MGRGRLGAGWIAIGLVVLGQWMIVGVVEHGNRWDTPAGARALGVWLVGLVAVAVVTRPLPVAEALPRPAALIDGDRRVERTRFSIGVALIAVGVLAVQGAEWNPGAAAACWLVAMCAVLAGAAGPIRAVRWRSIRPSAPGWVAWCVVAVAAVVRVSALGAHPRIADGDGAGFALLARAVARGDLTDPLATGYLDQPTLFAFIQRATMAIGGDTLAGARLASGIAGTTAVGVTFLLGRRLAGTAVGLAAAGVLAILPVHVHFSRLALNNVFDSLTLATALWLVVRAFDELRAFDAAAAGVVLGLGQYFYFTARFAALLVVVLAVWRSCAALRRGAPWRRVGALWGWASAGALAAYAPLAVHFIRYPATFNPRASLVLLIGDGHTAREARRSGTSVTENVVRALLSPFGASGNLTYHPGPPSIGWLFAVPLAIGVVACTIGGRRSGTGFVALAWWASFAAVGLTVGFATPRWVFATPIVALAIAFGLAAAWRMFAATAAVVAGARPVLLRCLRATTIAGAGVVLAAGALLAEFTGSALARYGDVNSLVATELADELAGQPPGTEVFGVMPPRMGLHSHHLTELMAPNVVAVDVAEPLTSVADVPSISGRAAFVFLPERVDELDVVRRRFPGGTVTTRTGEGLELYHVYWVDP